MRLLQRLLWTACALLAASHSAADEAPLKLRIVGGLAGVNQYTQLEEPFWTRDIARASNGRLSAGIVAFDQAGIRGEEMLRLMKTGSVPFGTILLSRTSAVEPELTAADLPGLNPDLATLRRHVAAFRPVMERILRERHGIEALAVYVYPSQVTFCSKPFNGLADLAGRRVRAANAGQVDLLRVLGAQPVPTEFAQIVSAVKSGAVDCAITGSMSGYTIGLDEVMTHVDPEAVSWGRLVFGASTAACAASWNRVLAPLVCVQAPAR